MSRTNAERAERAKKTLQFYKDLENEGGEPDCNEDVVDLLVDLHHYLRDSEGLDAQDTKDAMDNLLVSAEGHFDDEVANDDV